MTIKGSCTTVSSVDSTRTALRARTRWSAAKVALRSSVCRFFIGALLVHAGFAAHAAPGDLDSTFGASSALPGTVLTDVASSSNDIAAKVLAQPDQKVVVIGQCSQPGSSRDFCVARYNADGTPDTSFGVAGKRIYAVTTDQDLAYGAALQQDGKLVVVGSCNGDFCALRVTATGVLDSSFGTASNGITLLPFGSGNSSARDVAIQPDGKIVLVGECLNGASTEFCVARLTTVGALDTTFGVNGKVNYPAGNNGYDLPNALAIESGGRIVVAGHCSNGTYQKFCTTRITPSGALDNGFSGNGRVITPIGTGDDIATSVVIQPNGLIVVGGNCLGVSDLDFCAVRYNTNGTENAPFGIAGKLLSPVSTGRDTGGYITLQPDGKILQAGECGSVSQYCVQRYQDSGVLDTSFGTGGRVFLSLGSSEAMGKAIALQFDGNILVTGLCTGANGQTEFCTARFEGGAFGYLTCSLDLDGSKQVDQAVDALIGTRIALGMRGSAVIAGISFPSSASRTTWEAIRGYLKTQCQMSIAP
jgi:uncharacterized delta-60 repeat protein